MYSMFLGQPHQSIVDWINGHQYIPPEPPAEPSPYFIYGDDRYIIDISPTAPNSSYDEYLDTYTFSAIDPIVDNYALGIASNVFYNCGAASVSFPNLEYLGNNVFSEFNCDTFQFDKLQELNSGAFFNVHSQGYVPISISVKSINHTNIDPTAFNDKCGDGSSIICKDGIWNYSYGEWSFQPN